MSVPDLVGQPEQAALESLASAGLAVGERSEVNDERSPGTIVSQGPDPETIVEQGSAVDYVVSLGASIPPQGEGGDLSSAEVAAQLDAVAFEAAPLRGLPLGNTPYDTASAAQQRSSQAARSGLVHDPAAIGVRRRLSSASASSRKGR